MKENLVYIGTSNSIIEKLISSNLFEFTTVVCEEKRVTDTYLQTIKLHNLKLHSFNNNTQFEELIKQFDKQEFIFLIYQLDMIVPASIANNYSLFNLHAGNIATNRGAHPIIWSILNNDKESELTLHKINEKIDQGIIVSTYPVKIKITDDATAIKSNMEVGLTSLFNDLVMFLKGELKGSNSAGGKYYKPIQAIDFTIDPFTDSKEKIFNKIRSQNQYNGALIIHNNIKYNVKNLLCWKENTTNENNIYISKETITVERTDANFQLEISDAN